MTGSMGSAPQSDQAALLGVALAAVVSVSVSDGSWEPLETIVGVVLLAVIGAFFDFAALRQAAGNRKRRILAVAAVGALCVCLTAAWPIQSLTGSKLPGWVLPAVWAVAFAVFVLAGAWLSRRSPGGTTAASSGPAWTDKAQAIGVIGALVTALGAFAVAYFQLGDIQRQLESNASAAIFDQQMEVNKIFLEEQGADLMPYFFEGAPLPAGDPALQRRARLVANSILDYFSHLEDQAASTSFELDEGWSAYLRGSFERSPVLCDTLRSDLAAYGGAEGLLWREFASGACA